MSREQDIWGREQRRDAASEWPTTMSSTLSGDLRESLDHQPRRRGRRPSGYLGLAASFLVVLLLGVVGVLSLTHFLHR